MRQGVPTLLAARSAYPYWVHRSCQLLTQGGEEGDREGGRTSGHLSPASTSLLSEGIFQNEQSPNAKPGAAVESTLRKGPDQQNETELGGNVVCTPLRFFVGTKPQNLPSSVEWVATGHIGAIC